MTAAQTFVQCHAPHMDLLSFQGTSEPHRIGGDPSHQIRSSTLLASSGFTRFILLGMQTPCGCYAELRHQSRSIGHYLPIVSP